MTIASLEKLWSFVKKYWHIFVIAAGAIIGFIFFRSRGTSFVDELRKVQESHDEEIKKINSIREEERKQREKNLLLRDQTLAAVQKQYDDNLERLDSRKKKEIEQIVKEHGDDPKVLAEKLSTLTGFKIIMPD